MKKRSRYFPSRIQERFQIFKEYVSTHTGIIVKNVLLIIIVFVMISVLVSFLVFLLVRKGAPEVTVPKVTSKDLIEGMIVLQQKKLNVVIDPRYFSDYPKDTIVEQEPQPGSIVREGKVIKLVVSKGPIISIVEDYTGKTLAYVQNRLQEIFSFQGKSIKIGNITYVTSDEPKGVIVGQSPAPNTPIGSVNTIDLIVSQGRQAQAFYLQNYRGKDINKIMQIMALRGVLVQVIPEDVTDPSQKGIIISQDPEEGTLVKRNDTVTFHVGYLPSEKKEDKLYARVVNYDVPLTPDTQKEITVKIVVKDKIGEREIYNAKNKGGDKVSIPFKSYSPTTIYIYLNEGLAEIRKIE